ncbi:hypothetical protein L9F63_003730, partial [Diploptera punctata]
MMSVGKSFPVQPFSSENIASYLPIHRVHVKHVLSWDNVNTISRSHLMGKYYPFKVSLQAEESGTVPSVNNFAYSLNGFVAGIKECVHEKINSTGTTHSGIDRSFLVL